MLSSYQKPTFCQIRLQCSILVIPSENMTSYQIIPGISHSNDLSALGGKSYKSYCQNIEELHLQVSPTTNLHVTRSGQGATFLYLSFFEPDTTFKCMNKLLLLAFIPAMDKCFRNPSTGKRKSEFTLVVDNGPAKQSSSGFVQTCFVQ